MLEDIYLNITSDHDKEFTYEDMSGYGDEEVQCHMDRLNWEQTRLREEVGRTCPPFWDR
jgi:hypothetical protein